MGLLHVYLEVVMSHACMYADKLVKTSCWCCDCNSTRELQSRGGGGGGTAVLVIIFIIIILQQTRNGFTVAVIKYYKFYSESIA